MPALSHFLSMARARTLYTEMMGVRTLQYVFAAH
jgi:hypothetical protein